MKKRATKHLRKMAAAKKTPKKKAPRAKPRKKGTESKAGEYVDSLLELHKLQGVLLVSLRQEVI
jgi:hypothetical protein